MAVGESSIGDEVLAVCAALVGIVIAIALLMAWAALVTVASAAMGPLGTIISIVVPPAIAARLATTGRGR